MYENPGFKQFWLKIFKALVNYLNCHLVFSELCQLRLTSAVLTLALDVPYTLPILVTDEREQTHP